MPCCVYRDKILYSAQVLSIAALILSYASLLSGATGLVCTFVLQVVWCCRMKKLGLIIASVLALFIGIFNFVVAFLVFGEWDPPHAAILLVGGCLWGIVSFLVAVFTCTSRFDKAFKESEERERPQEDDRTTTSSPPSDASPPPSEAAGPAATDGENVDV